MEYKELESALGALAALDQKLSRPERFAPSIVAHIQAQRGDLMNQAVALFRAECPADYEALVAKGAAAECARIKGIDDALQACLTPGEQRFYAHVIRPLAVDGKSTGADVLLAVNASNRQGRAGPSWL